MITENYQAKNNHSQGSDAVSTCGLFPWEEVGVGIGKSRTLDKNKGSKDPLFFYAEIIDARFIAHLSGTWSQHKSHLFQGYAEAQFWHLSLGVCLLGREAAKLIQYIGQDPWPQEDAL